MSAKLTKADMESWLVTDSRGIKLIGEYTNVTTKTTFECAHRHQWDARPDGVKKGKGCPQCAGNIKLTKADMESWLVTDGRGIKLIGEYINNATKTKFECAHGHHWMAAPNNIKSGNGCPRCAGKIKLTKSDIESWLIEDGRGIKLIGDYTNSRTKTTFECTHGHQWSTIPYSIKMGTGCSICYYQDRTLTKSDIESWLIEDGRGIKLIGDYMGANIKTTFECVDGHQWMTKPAGVKSDKGCLVCSNKKRTFTKSDIESWLIEDGRGIKLIGDYINVDTKTTFECAHGHQWQTMPKKIKEGTGCSICTPGGFNPGLPAWTYIFIRGNYLKYGITGKLNKRMYTHRTYGEIEIVHLKHHENGQDALDWENQIKQKFGGKYVTDALCPDGWTETLPITHLQLLLEEKFIDKIQST